MKKQEIKGLSAARLLDGLDDDMILSASLPEATPVPTPTVGEKIEAFFGRMGKGGMAAAVTGIVVAAAVLIGILLAGRMEGLNTPHADTDHGVHGSQGGTEAMPDTNGGLVIPPLEESPDNTQKSGVSVVSDGITVYPNRYCVYMSASYPNDDGTMDGLDADGPGAVYQLAEIWDELPILRTAGDSYELNLPKDNMSLRGVRVFTTDHALEGFFEERALISDDMEDYRDRPWEFLSSILPSGEYIVVLEIYHETIYSADEYTKGLDEYAFCLAVDPSMNDRAPVRVIQDDKTYFPSGYLLEESYYDAELQKEVVKHYIGAESTLKELAKTLPTATVTQGESLSLYLAPFYDLKSVKVYRDLTLWALSETEEPLTQLAEWGAGDYYVIITAAFLGTGETSVTEFPIHIKIVEEAEEETYPNDDGEIPDTPGEAEPPIVPPETNPRVVVSGGGQSAVFETEEDGFLAWTAYRLDAAVNSMYRVEITPADSVIFTDDDALRALPDMEIVYGTPLTLSLGAAGDELFGVILYDAKGGVTAEGTDLSVVDTLENEGWDRGVILVLQVLSRISETEHACYEYAIDLTITQP